MNERRRLSASRRKRIILVAAIAYANKHGLIAVTAARVAECCRVPTSEATVRHYFSTHEDLLSEIVNAEPDLKPQLEELDNDD